LRANAVEAAEQCNILSVPEIAEARKLEVALADFPADRTVIFCDEEAAAGDPLAALDALRGRKSWRCLSGRRAALMMQSALCWQPARMCTLSLSLGPRILRTDTAVVAALALVQARLG
jgi:16S rRNA (uracil1498-N3)-methyltransferase